MPVDLSSFHQRSKEFLEKMDQLIRNLCNETKLPVVINLLSNFADYAGQYFRDEEAYYSRRLDHCEFIDHRERHLFLESYLQEPILKSNEKNQCDTKELCEFLIDWIRFHIQHVDENVFVHCSVLK
jgi:hemerythrin